MGSASLDILFDKINREATHSIQERTLVAMRLYLKEMGRGLSVTKAGKTIGVNASTVRRWRNRHPAFDEAVDSSILTNKVVRGVATEARRVARGQAAPQLEARMVRRDRPNLTDFRMEYFGRPTPIHQVLAVEALEDQSNLYVFIFGPTGMGKDTLAGDYVGWEVAPDDTGKRVAWFMEAGNFSIRRMGRIARYLTDPKVYEHKPGKTPDGAIPTRSLIDDYGPFKWEPGMLHEDGSKVEKTGWTQNSMYFVRVLAPEQDPNLWATGVGGATYGSRIDVCVLSDAFTVENQRSPGLRQTEYEWVEGTLDTRLDEAGRLVVIGTMLPIENNYERLLAEYTAGARVVFEKEVGPGTYTKYSNGVAVVIIKALVTDPSTGVESSYWPERFPLDNQYQYKGKVYWEKDLSVERIAEITEGGARLFRGLRDRRERSPVMFKAMFQQERDLDVAGDFTEETLDRSKNPDRTFGVAYAHELIFIGIDPAIRYGAAWVALAVDRRENVVTLVDFFYGDNLGVTGIKDRLILEPLVKWNPVWLCYETNRESAVLEDSLIVDAIRSSGVSVFKHHTGRERGSAVVGVGSIAHFMRSGQFRIPFQTAADRARFEVVASHFKAWDADPGRSKPGRSGHAPDDLAMGTWIAWLKAQEMLDKGKSNTHGMRSYVPERLLLRQARMRKVRRAGRVERLRPRQSVSAEDIMGWEG